MVQHISASTKSEFSAPFYADLYANGSRTCYCADRLDADTRAVADEGDCDVPCPGNDEQLCGGLAARTTSNSRRWMPARRDAPSSVLLTVYASLADTETPEPPPGMGASRPSMSRGQGGNQAGATGSGGRPTAVVSGDASGATTLTRTITEFDRPDATDFPTNGIAQLEIPAAATITRVIEDPGRSDTGAVSPIMADLDRPGVRTTVTYLTVFPSDPAALVPQERVVTLLYEDCGCDTPKLMEPPMETKVVECDGCGADGQSAVTLTVPITVSVVVPATGSSTGQGQPNGDEPQQGESSQGQTDQEQPDQEQPDGQSDQGQPGQEHSFNSQPQPTQPNQIQAPDELTTVLTSYQTIQVVSEETLDNKLVVTRTKKQTIVVAIRPSGDAGSQVDDANAVENVVPAQATAPDQPTIPTGIDDAAAAATTPTPGAAGTPGSPVVVGEAWSATESLKTSIALSVAVALLFTMLL